MRAEKKRRLEAAGWRVGSAEEFLRLTAEEATLVDLRLRLADALAAAAVIGSSEQR